MNNGRMDAPNQEQREARTMMEKLPEFLVALLLLQASSWAQDPAPPLENSRPVYGGSLQHRTEDSQQGTTLYFPDYVDGDGWAVELALSNVNASVAAVAVVEVYGQDGQPVLDLFDSESPIEIPSFGSRVLRSAGAGPIRRGWIQVRTDPASVTGLLTYRQTGTGVEVSVEPVELGNRFALFVEESDTLGAGLAIFKPEASSGIELQIRDEEGNDPLEGEFPPRRDFKQAALTLPEWFGVEGVDTDFPMDFRGLLFVGTANGSQFASLGLRFGKRIPALSAVPAIRNPGREPLETILYFPDYVDGDGWAVQLALSNVAASAAADALVAVYGEDGQPVLDLFDSESSFEIPSLGSRILKSSGEGPIRRGWIQVRTNPASISGLLTYRQTGTGVEVSVEPVELGNRFALFVEESDTLGTGLAIFKPEASSEIELRVRDEEGKNPLEGEFLPLEGLQASCTYSPGVVRSGRDRHGFPHGLSGSAVGASRGWIPVRPAGAAVREEEPCALGGSCYTDHGRRRYRGQRPAPGPDGDPVGFAEFDRFGPECDVELVLHQRGNRGDHSGHREGADIGFTGGDSDAHDHVSHHRA